jgi:[ribosomal protein S5]-alanine N-acetyltransferase
MPYLVPPVVPVGRMSSQPQPTLRCAERVLRPWCERDVEALIAAYRDVDIKRWHARTVDTPGEARALIGAWTRCWTDESAARWAVANQSTDEVVGQVALRSIDRQEGEAELSYWVLPQARRTGVATAAVLELARWAFEELGLHRLELHHSVSNASSCRVAASAGFGLEGTMSAKAVHMDGRHDMHLHARVRDGGALGEFGNRRTAAGS